MFSKKGGNVRIGKFEFTDVGRLRKSSRRLWTIFVREEVWDNNLNDSQNIYLRVLSFLACTEQAKCEGWRTSWKVSPTTGL